MDFIALSQQCAASIPAKTMQAVARVESGFNPYAIGVVRGRLARQPRNLAEAVATAQALKRAGWNFSLGIAQVNLYNLEKYKLNFSTAFDPCSNVRAAADILKDCFDRARSRTANDRTAWNMAYSCYYSGNFKTGFKADFKGQPSYVNKILAGMGDAPAPIAVARFRPSPSPSDGGSAESRADTRETANDGWTVFGAKEV